jgi:hypothetical protein
MCYDPGHASTTRVLYIGAIEKLTGGNARNRS